MEGSIVHTIIWLVVLAAVSALDAPKAKEVSFTTSDKVKIAADYFAPASAKDKAPVAILIHMYPADRSSWALLIAPLHDAGFAVLAYDIRGKAGSADGKDGPLSKSYEAHEAKLFQAAWQDVEAAKKWLATQKECDTSRIVLIGASIGCSISIEYAGREDAVKAIVCLSPGTNYFGVDSVAAIKRVKTKNILLISPEAEQDQVNMLVKATNGLAMGGKFPGNRELHGTNILADSYHRSGQIKQSIVDFISKATKKAGSPDKDSQSGQ
jgi:dienelactone hydrolase